MAIDPRLSHTAFRVACVIGRHFNNATGMTFLGLPGIAAIMEISPRQAGRAVKELRDLGYLIVTTGRGKGHANEYSPALDHVMPDAPKAAA